MKARLTDQKYLRLLRMMSPRQAQEYLSRLQRGFMDTRIRRSKLGGVIVYMEKHDAIGNFAIAIGSDGRVRGGKINADGSMAEPVKRF
jgi:hypothetical protein